MSEDYWGPYIDRMNRMVAEATPEPGDTLRYKTPYGVDEGEVLAVMRRAFRVQPPRLLTGKQASACLVAVEDVCGFWRKTTRQRTEDNLLRCWEQRQTHPSDAR